MKLIKWVRDLLFFFSFFLTCYPLKETCFSHVQTQQQRRENHKDTFFCIVTELVAFWILSLKLLISTPSLCAELPRGNGSAAWRSAVAVLESGAGRPHPGAALPRQPHLGGESVPHVLAQVQLLLQLCGEQHVRGPWALPVCGWHRSFQSPQVVKCFFFYSYLLCPVSTEQTTLNRTGIIFWAFPL